MLRQRVRQLPVLVQLPVRELVQALVQQRESVRQQVLVQAQALMARELMRRVWWRQELQAWPVRCKTLACYKM